MGKEEFQKALASVLKKVTSEESTSLSLPALKQVLSTPALGLTKKDVNLLLGYLEVSQHSCVAMEDVLTKSFDVLVERHEDALALDEVWNCCGISNLSYLSTVAPCKDR